MRQVAYSETPSLQCSTKLILLLAAPLSCLHAQPIASALVSTSRRQHILCRCFWTAKNSYLSTAFFLLNNTLPMLPLSVEDSSDANTALDIQFAPEVFSYGHVW